MQAINVAANFEKATAVIANVPGFSDVLGETLAGRRKNGMPKGDGVAYYDAAVAAQFIKCPVYIISGLGDTICPPCTQMALFNAIPSQKYIEFYQNKTHSFTIPWDNHMYVLGDASLADRYSDLTAMYYDWN
jgi:pimeloyl-ACP methyl ester carboxylesterase